MQRKKVSIVKISKRVKMFNNAEKQEAHNDKRDFDGYKYIEGGVCAAKGFVANGLNCGINPVKEKFDLGVVYSEKECNAAGVYTQNKSKRCNR